MSISWYSLIIISCIFIVVGLSINAEGATLSNINELTLESRIFENDNLSNTNDHNESLFLRSTTKYRKKSFKAQLRGYGRVGFVDGERNIGVLEDAWVSYKFDEINVKTGFEVHNWTATEAFHPADIINGLNLESNLENPEKLGEPIVSLDYRLGVGDASLFWLPYRVQTVYGPDSSRLSGLGKGVDIDEALWFDGETLDSDSKSYDQWGFRFTQTIGDADIGIHYVEHYDRHQPVLLSLKDNVHHLVPIYFKSKNIGATYSHVIDASVFKVEFNHKDFIEQKLEIYDNKLGGELLLEQPDHSQLALGFEHNIFHDSGTETALYVEAQHVFGVDKDTAKSLSVFQNDIFLGFRHSFNDIMGRDIFAFIILDAEKSSEQMYNIRYQQRLSDVLTFQAGFRVVEANKESAGSNGLLPIEEGDHLFVNLTLYF